MSLSNTAALVSVLRLIAGEDGYLGATEGFPNLTPTNNKVIGPPTNQYNCLGDALGFKRWVDLPLFAGYLPGILEKHGFTQDAFNFNIVPGHQKVVIYQRTSGSVMHIIRQSRDGFISKMGGNRRIKIWDPNVLSGPNYGKPAQVYTRPRDQIKPRLRALLDTPITEAGIPAPFVLNRVGISTLRDLVKRSEDELRTMKLEPSHFFSLRFALSTQGLALREGTRRS